MTAHSLIARLILIAATFALTCESACAAVDAIDISPRLKPNTCSRVTIEFDAGGDDLVRAESPDKDTAPAVGAEQKLPMSVSAKLQYDELRLVGETRGVSSAPAMLAIRFYDRAEAILKVDTSGLAPKLAEDRRLIVVESGHARSILYSPSGPLPREQLDLIDVGGNSCVIDQLLPTAPVATNDTWDVEAAVIGSLLGLDSVAVCEVQCVLDEHNASFAKIRLAGVVHGTVDGAATQQEARGVYLFDREAHRITRLNLAIREKRSIGGATPGLNGVAKMQIKIDPLDGSPRLTEPVVAAARRSALVAPHDLVYESKPLGFCVEYDRNWFVTSEARETVTLRRLDGNNVVAHCTVTKLPPKSHGRQIPLEQFQKDVTYSLGKGFGQLVSSRQWKNPHGHLCFEVVVRGSVEETPVEWRHFLVAQESGHRVSLAFTIEGSRVPRVSQADRRLVDAIRLLPEVVPTAETAAASQMTTAK